MTIFSPGIQWKGSLSEAGTPSVLGLKLVIATLPPTTTHPLTGHFIVIIYMLLLVTFVFHYTHR